MAMTVKDLAASSSKWSQRASGASSEFEQNALAAAEKWGRNTAAAADNYRAGIAVGNIAQRFARGVAKAAQTNKYSRKLAAVGAQRYGTGVTNAAQDWATGFEPYHNTLQALSLPPRRPRGDAANYQRVQAVGAALNARRIAMLGAGS